MPDINLSEYHNVLSRRNQVMRAIWNLVWVIFCRFSPAPLHGWRRLFLRLFGAQIGRGATIYPSAHIWAPWNLEMGEFSCLSHYVICYSVAPVRIGPHATVSQYSHLCTASHDIEDPHMRLVTAPIVIGKGAWITTDVFVGPGVEIGDGAVVGARSTVTKDVEPWAVVAGNPARLIKYREIKEPSATEPAE